MFYMYSGRKEIIVLSYSLMIRKHCGKMQTYTHKEKNKKERESDPIVVFCPVLMKDWEVSVITEIGWHWAPSRMTMGHQQDHDQGLRIQPSPALPPATIQPESPPGILPWSPRSLSFKKLRPSAERSGHQTGSLQGTFPSGKLSPNYRASRSGGGGQGWKRLIWSAEWGEEGR